jgi:uncharacterized protein (DUF302 family)
MSSKSTHSPLHLRSPYTVSETIAGLEEVVRSKGVTVLARTDHSGDAARVGLEVNPTELLIFGSPKAGTPLKIASATVAIDLPLKALAWQDADGRYGSPITARSIWLSGSRFRPISYRTSLGLERCVKRLRGHNHNRSIRTRKN